MLLVAWNNVVRGPLAGAPSIMGEICIGDVRSLFKSNYAGRLTRSQVVAFQIADTGVLHARDVVRVPLPFAYGIELFHSPTLPRSKNSAARGGEEGEGNGRVVSFRRTDCAEDHWLVGKLLRLPVLRVSFFRGRRMWIWRIGGNGVILLSFDFNWTR